MDLANIAWWFLVIGFCLGLGYILAYNYFRVKIENPTVISILSWLGFFVLGLWAADLVYWFFVFITQWILKSPPIR